MTFTSATATLIKAPECPFEAAADPAPAAAMRSIKGMRDTQQQQYINHDQQRIQQQQAMMQQRQQ